MRYDDAAAQIPALAVSVPDADHLAALHAAGRPLRLALTVAAQQGVEALSHNVLCELPGQGALLNLICHADPEPLTGCRAGVTEALSQVICGALAKSPEARPAHWQAFAQQRPGVLQRGQRSLVRSPGGRSLPLRGNRSDAGG